jgi:hypothetical protein
LWEILTTYVLGLLFKARLDRLRKRIEQDPEARRYTDIAITPVVNVEEEGLQMYQSTEATRAALTKAKAREARHRTELEPVSA